MGKTIGVSKVSRMLGVKRSELNKRLLAAGITTFEGEVDLERVKDIAPTLNLDTSEFMEKIGFIRNNAAGFRGDMAESLSKEELTKEVKKLTKELLIETQMSHSYRQILVNLSEKMGELQAKGTSEQQEWAFGICEWLRAEIVKE